MRELFKTGPIHPHDFGPGQGLRQLLLVQHQSSGSVRPSFQQDRLNSRNEIILGREGSLSPREVHLEDVLNSLTLILQLLSPMVTFSRNTFRFIGKPGKGNSLKNPYSSFPSPG